MARSSSRSSQSGPGRLWRTILVVVLIGAAYWYQQKDEGESRSDKAPVLVELPIPAEPSITATPVVIADEEAAPGAEETPGAPAPAPKPAPAKATVTKVNGYDRLDGCRLVDHRNNDGDSFHVRHGDREFELRLYYVDSPEKYLSDRYADQRQRVAEQGRDFGGLSPEQTVEVGKAAKMYTERLLQGKTFTVFTKWESVYNSERVYAFVQLPGSEEYLGEELVEKGLVRIHTKGEPTPDGQSYRDHKARLEALERAAREAGRGAWGLN